MKSPMDMNKKRAYKKGLLLVVMCLGWSLVFSQSKESLQKEKEAIAEKIAYAKKLLSESRKNEQSANTQLQLLEKQILFRKQLIGSIGAEIDQIEKNIDDSRAEIEHKEEYIVALKAEYKEMVYQSYKNRSAYNKVMYIFASESFDQAYKRLKTMQSYTESRQKQADENTRVPEHHEVSQRVGKHPYLAILEEPELRQAANDGNNQKNCHQCVSLQLFQAWMCITKSW